MFLWKKLNAISKAEVQEGEEAVHGGRMERLIREVGGRVRLAGVMWEAHEGLRGEGMVRASMEDEREVKMGGGDVEMQGEAGGLV